MCKRILVLLALCTVVFAGCSAMLPEGFYEDNGWIAQKSDSVVARVWIGSSGGNTCKVSGTFTGSKTVWTYNAGEDGEVEISYRLSSLDGGAAKLVLVDSDGNVSTVFENADLVEQSGMTALSLTVSAGENRLKLVGSDRSKIEFELWADEGKLSS